ncbi:MAG TPA: nicotinate-nucleotide adenylyltransferase [Candidatus Angelobacter sp.]|nr:nicotinate-nucleotide adenylyltransferase [Candidatus Angelobacter sp.]
MRLALLGGTFDPVHLGHLAIARAAVEKFDLDVVYFVPADVPPHKRGRNLTEFQHRFAMLALATAEEQRFVPSLLEANSTHPNYSIETVRRFKSTLGPSDKLYFLIGVDAFMEIGSWKQPVELLSECDFVVASRPGHSLKEIAKALPEPLRSANAVLHGMEQPGNTIQLPSTAIHLLDNVDQPISSTQIRTAANKSVEQLSKHVGRLVAEYIRKEHLYLEPEPNQEK